eukprot:3281191-Prymnesium_polylepis.1
MHGRSYGMLSSQRFCATRPGSSGTIGSLQKLSGLVSLFPQTAEFWSAQEKVGQLRWSALLMGRVPVARGCE